MMAHARARCRTLGRAVTRDDAPTDRRGPPSAQVRQWRKALRVGRGSSPCLLMRARADCTLSRRRRPDWQSRLCLPTRKVLYASGLRRDRAVHCHVHYVRDRTEVSKQSCVAAARRLQINALLGTGGGQCVRSACGCRLADVESGAVTVANVGSRGGMDAACSRQTGCVANRSLLQIANAADRGDEGQLRRLLDRPGSYGAMCCRV